MFHIASQENVKITIWKFLIWWMFKVWFSWPFPFSLLLLLDKMIRQERKLILTAFLLLLVFLSWTSKIFIIYMVATFWRFPWLQHCKGFHGCNIVKVSMVAAFWRFPWLQHSESFHGCNILKVSMVATFWRFSWLQYSEEHMFRVKIQN